MINITLQHETSCGGTEGTVFPKSYGTLAIHQAMTSGVWEQDPKVITDSYTHARAI